MATLEELRAKAATSNDTAADDTKEEVDVVSLYANNESFQKVIIIPAIEKQKEMGTIDVSAAKYMDIDDKQERLDAIDKDLTYNKGYLDAIQELLGEFIDRPAQGD